MKFGSLAQKEAKMILRVFNLVVESLKLFIIHHISNSTHPMKATFLMKQFITESCTSRTPSAQIILDSNNRRDAVL